MTQVSREDAERVVAGLTAAQRALLCRIDHRVWSRRDIHHRTFDALYALGIVSDIRVSGHRMFNLTDAGLAVRALLLERNR